MWFYRHIHSAITSKSYVVNLYFDIPLSILNNKVRRLECSTGSNFFSLKPHCIVNPKWKAWHNSHLLACLSTTYCSPLLSSSTEAISVTHNNNSVGNSQSSLDYLTCALKLIFTIHVNDAQVNQMLDNRLNCTLYEQWSDSHARHE